MAVVVLAPVGYYLLAPIWNVVELDEASPLVGPGSMPGEGSRAQVLTGMEEMDAMTRAEFEHEMEMMAGKVMVIDDAMPQAGTARVLAQAPFIARAHDVKGKALLIEHEGKRTIRFEDFETINGPKLDIYLASELDDNDFIDLGPIRATKGNVNYEVPEGVDAAKYNKVLVWCVTFGVLFSSAELQ